MEVILNEDIRALGKKGQKVNVSDGYAKNYLFPKKLATEANATSINEMQSKKEAADFKNAQAKAAAEEIKQQIEGKTVELHIKSGANGKLFGAVTGKEISAAFKEKYGYEIDKKKIAIQDNIKNYGTYPVVIKLFPEIAANISVIISEQ